MRSTILLTLLCMSGCATTPYDLRLVSRGGTDKGTGTIEQLGQGSGSINVSLAGRNYTGTWTATRTETHGHITSFGRRFARTDTISTVSSLQQGLALLSATGGATLRCEFQADYSAGFGHCEDGQGKKYDLQILPSARQ